MIAVQPTLDAPPTVQLRHGLTALYVYDPEARAQRLLAHTPGRQKADEDTDRCGAPTQSGRPCRNRADVCAWHRTHTKGQAAS